MNKLVKITFLGYTSFSHFSLLTNTNNTRIMVVSGWCSNFFECTAAIVILDILPL